MEEVREGLLIAKVSKVSSNGETSLIYIPKILREYGFVKGKRVLILLDRKKKRVIIELLEEGGKE